VTANVVPNIMIEVNATCENVFMELWLLIWITRWSM
jgi:hypothetical protein